MTTKPTALPEPNHQGLREDYFTQQQLIDYGRAEYLRAIEDAAALVDRTDMGGLNSQFAIQAFIADMLLQFAKAIRALAGEKT
jgi:hypothetical protein